MVENGGLTILCAVAAAGGWGWFAVQELEKRGYISRQKRLHLWGAGIPVFIGIAFLFKEYGYSYWKMQRYLILLYALPVLAWIDKKEKKLPNQILGVLALIRCVILVGEIASYTALWEEFLAHAFLGAAFSFVLMMAAYYISKKAIGMGDVKLLAIMGFYLGFSLNYTVLFVSLLFAAAYAVWNMLRKKLEAKDEIAFAPFVSAGLWLVLLVGF